MSEALGEGYPNVTTAAAQAQVGSCSSLPCSATDCLQPAAQPRLAAKEHMPGNTCTVRRRRARAPPVVPTLQATYAFESSSGVYDALPSIRLPTLVVTGEDDLVVPPENAQTLVDRLPNAQLYEVSAARGGQLRGGKHGGQGGAPRAAASAADRAATPCLARPLQMPGAGHGAWAQDTPAFAARVNEFIASLASAGTAPAPAPYSAALPAAGLAWLAAAALAAAVATVV